MSAAAHDDPGGTPDREESSASPIKSWFALAIAIGLAVRLFLVFATPGTLDVDVWKFHTVALEKRGLISYYEGGALRFNHPPPAAWLVSSLGHIATATGIPFAALLRLPFSLLDLASVWLILRLLAGTAHARAVAAAYWLHPLAIIFSSHHGNTDSGVAFFLLAATLLTSQGRGLSAGVILGLSLWLKIPGILAGPILFFALPNFRQRAHFCVALATVTLTGFAPALLLNARAVVDAVFLYPGLSIHTSSGITIWGIANLYPDVQSLPQALRLSFLDFTQVAENYNTVICVTPIILLAWLRRSERSATAIATSVAAGFSLFYGLTNNWAFQYLAWSLPFWLLATRWFALSASLVATAYVYGAYAWLCGDALLLGSWDFIGKPDWPTWLIVARNAANVFFLTTGLYFLIQFMRAERSRMKPAIR